MDKDKKDLEQAIIPMTEYKRLKQFEEEYPSVMIVDDARAGYWFPMMTFEAHLIMDSMPTKRYYVKNDAALAKLQKINDETIETMKTMKQILDAKPTFNYKTSLTARIWFLLSGKLIKE